MRFKFFKKEEVPDVGKEELPSEVTEVNPDDIPVSSDSVEENMGENIKNNSGSINSNSDTRFEVERMSGKLEVLDGLVKGFNERFSNVNQQIGELRSMSLTNEKNLSLSTLESQKAVDIVKEVEPDKIKIEYQKMDMKVQLLTEKLESTNQYLETVMDELKDIKREQNNFVGTDALLKLNEDIKKDLIGIQKLGSKVRVDADKTESIFIEMNKRATEEQKLFNIIGNLDSSYSGIKKEIDRLNLEYSEFIKNNEFSEFKKQVANRLAIVENFYSEIEKDKEENQKMSDIVEKILQMERRNEEDIASLGIKSGNNNVKRLSDYEERMFSILDILDKMSFEIKNLKSQLGKKGVVNFTPLPTQKKVDKYEQDVTNILKNSTGGKIDEKISNVNDNLSDTSTNPNLSIDEALNKSLRDISVSKENEIKTEQNDEEKIPLLEEKRYTHEFKDDLNKPIPLPVFNEDPKKKRLKFEKEINDKLLLGGKLLVERNYEGAGNIYNEISNLYDPNLDKRKTVYEKIMRFRDNIIKLAKKPVKIQR